MDAETDNKAPDKSASASLPETAPIICRAPEEPQAATPPKPLLVGEDNPWGSDPAFALYPLPPHAAGGRLQSLVMGVSRGEYLRRFDRVNLCASKWSTPAARERAAELLKGPHETFVLCGAKVREAFLRAKCSTGLASYPIEIDGKWVMKTLVCIPHPSGRNLVWNDPNEVERVRALLREAGVLRG